MNEHLINFYRNVQQGLRVDTEFQNAAGYYYAAREEFNPLISGEAATGPRAASSSTTSTGEASTTFPSANTARSTTNGTSPPSAS